MTKQEIILANQQYLFPSVFHYYKEPLVVTRAKDQFVWDADGNQFLDFFGGIVTISVGHCNDTVNRKVHEQIDKLVARALRRIPARFRKRLENIVIVVEREPPRPGLLGLYQGRPLTERSVSEGFRMPDQITIYQGPHERMARSETHLEQEVADTVWHEIAHYFGMDEARVRRAERRRDRL